MIPERGNDYSTVRFSNEATRLIFGLLYWAHLQPAGGGECCTFEWGMLTLIEIPYAASPSPYGVD